jgi:hypothetical protein
VAVQASDHAPAAAGRWDELIYWPAIAAQQTPNQLSQALTGQMPAQKSTSM